MKSKIKSIFYINYSPYENAGYILDYLIDNFKYVFLFSIGFHDLGLNRNKNILKVYKDGKLITIKNYFHLNIPIKLEYLFVPIRSILNFLQIFMVIKYIFAKYGKVDMYLSVNAFIGWIGLILRGLGFVKKTIFWVWDYYPLNHKNYLILLMRWIYWQFDRVSMFSDKVVFLNDRLFELYRIKGVVDKNLKYSIIPIGTKNVIMHKKLNSKNIKIVFLGVLKISQGLKFVFDVFSKKINRKIDLEIIGGGPDSQYFVDKAKSLKINVKFFGHISDSEVDKIISKADIGVATYIPDKSNVSYYGDPSKVKRYLSFGVPVITTNVYHFSKEIENRKAGFIVSYGNIKEFIKSMNKILSRHSFYSKNALFLANEYKYSKIYPEMFK